MGLMDRDYYRDTAPPHGGYTFSSNYPATVGLIVAHVAVFVFVVLSRQDIGSLLVFEPDAVKGGQIWRLLSYAFVPRGGAWALLWNMLFLWWFGREVEALYGARNFVAIYLLGAMAGAVAALLLALSGVPVAVLGGAGPPILTVLTIFALWYPRHRIYFFGLFPIEVRWLVAIYVGIDLLNILAVRGALLPFAVARLAAAGWGAVVKTQNIRPGDLLGRLLRWRPRPRPPLRVVPPPETGGLEEELDELLARVKAVGLEGLSAAERARLEELSRELKQRRAP